MAVQSRQYLKTRFEKDDTPSQQDFVDLIDSMMLVDADLLSYDHELLTYEHDVLTIG